MPTKVGRPQVNIRSSLILMLTALIWGMAFVAQRVGMEFIGPFLFMGIRMLMGAVTLFIVLAVSLLLFRRSQRERGDRQDVAAQSTQRAAQPVQPVGEGLSLFVGFKRLLLAGVACGSVLFLAGSLQQIGLVSTAASKGGFLTTLYIIIVPILGILIRHKTHWNTWVSVGIAAVGLYFLCITESFTIEPGDLVMLAGAFFWACHILVIDHFVEGLNQRDVMRLCVLQFIVASILSLLVSPFLDGSFVSGSFDPALIMEAMPAMLYTGVLSTGVAFTFQAIGQQGLSPSAASIIMSLEAVFSVIGGMLLLHEVLSGREALGCLLMFAAVILSQLPVGQPQQPEQPEQPEQT